MKLSRRTYTIFFLILATGLCLRGGKPSSFYRPFGDVYDPPPLPDPFPDDPPSLVDNPFDPVNGLPDPFDDPFPIEDPDLPPFQTPLTRSPRRISPIRLTNLLCFPIHLMTCPIHLRTSRRCRTSHLQERSLAWLCHEPQLQAAPPTSPRP